MTDWTAVSEALSSARLAPYWDKCDGDPRRALTLYAWNADLAGAFQVPLGQLEVVVRNAIHDALAVRAGTDRWWERHRDLVADYDSILRCIAYVSPPTAIWVDDISRVVEVRQQRPQLR